MQKIKFSIVLLALLSLAACGKSETGAGDKTAAGDAAAEKTAAAPTGTCELVSTKDNKPLPIKVTDKDTPEAKEFLATCINPYTKKYAADAEAAKAGKKLFGMYSCTQCHGPNGDGQVGPPITDARWQYAKHVTDKGMFETIAGGTNGGMFAWHQQVANNPDMMGTDDILKIVGWLRTQYKGGGDTPWLN
jgi:cytochrome c-L